MRFAWPGTRLIRRPPTAMTRARTKEPSVDRKTLFSFGGIAVILLRGLAAAEDLPIHSVGKSLIQIGVEVVEVDERRARDLGVQWINTFHIEEANVPAFFSLGTFTRSRIFAD